MTPLINFLPGCSMVQITDHTGRLCLISEEFFDGLLTAHSVVKNRPGKVIRYFHADIQAYGERPVGALIEGFIFDDGERQQRVWTLMRQSQCVLSA